VPAPVDAPFIFRSNCFIVREGFRPPSHACMLSVFEHPHVPSAPELSIPPYIRSPTSFCVFDLGVAWPLLFLSHRTCVSHQSPLDWAVLGPLPAPPTNSPLTRSVILTPLYKPPPPGRPRDFFSRKTPPGQSSLILPIARVPPVPSYALERWSEISSIHSIR